MKICHVVFSTNRLEFLTRTLESQKNFDFGGTEVHKIFFDDYPFDRDDQKITELVKGYGYEEVVLHQENMGITSTWNEMFRIVRNRGFDYILHQEDDVELMYPVKVTDMIELIQSDSTISQVQLKRNPWYPKEFHEPLLIPEDKPFKQYMVERGNPWFWSLSSLYPSWVAYIDFPKVSGACPSEGVIANYLRENFNKTNAILKNSDGTNIVNHIGEYFRGKRVNENEPGWEGFKMFDPRKRYSSRTGAEM